MTASRLHLSSYYIPAFSECVECCELCDYVGCTSDRPRSDESDWDRSLKKALSGGFSEVLLSPAAWTWEGLDLFKQKLAQVGLSLRLRINPQTLGFLIAHPIASVRIGEFDKEWIIDGRQELGDSGLLESFVRPEDRFTFVALRTKNILEKLNHPFLARRHDKLRFYFPLYHEKAAEGVLSPIEAFKTQREIESKISGLKVRAPQEYELWERRVASDFEFEPMPQDVLELGGGERSGALISVVIPTYNNIKYLLVTLRHLADQNLDPAQYEVIVVDDGSTDQTRQKIADWHADHQIKMRLKYVYFPRRVDRRMGDAQFRAGVARNLGVKVTEGQMLSFLDSDVVTPKRYLSELLQLHESSDLVQCVRLDLSQEASHSLTSYDKIDPHRHTVPFEGSYWSDFFAAPNWEDLPFHWKYTCTYGLSISRGEYFRLGRLRRTFVYYGFEDTDLGYRIANAGGRFKMNKTLTYHLYHRPERSEYANSMSKRREVLGKTAQIFYHNHLDPDIFRHFRSFMVQSSRSF